MNRKFKQRIRQLNRKLRARRREPASSKMTWQGLESLEGRMLLSGTSPLGVEYGNTIERISVSSSGVQANGGSINSVTQSISEDGRYISFLTQASNLDVRDPNVFFDAYLHDRLTGTTELISRTADGTVANYHTYFAALSNDARYVALQSWGSNLVPDDVGGYRDIFHVDRNSFDIVRVSETVTGTSTSVNNETPGISADGQFVTFTSVASNLVVSDTNFTFDIFVYDVQGETLERVSVANDGSQANGPSELGSLSADGRYVAFQSNASNLVTGDTNFTYDIFVRDRQADTTRRISVASDGTQANNASTIPTISQNGRYVAFLSKATNLVAGKVFTYDDVFVHDLQTGTTEAISLSPEGEFGNSHSYTPSLSADGRYVAFTSAANNLVPNDTNLQRDVFVHDRSTGQTRRVNITHDGQQANSSSSTVAISPDGRYITFNSAASNLVPGDTNNVEDVFVVGNPLFGSEPVQLSVTGNGVTIADNDQTPSANDHTSFGNVTQGGAAVSRVFTVTNDGNSTLTFGNVTVPTGFTLVEGLAASLAPGASDTFTVRLDTAVPGVKLGDVSFSVTGAETETFNFSITGNITEPVAPEITVLGASVVIVDGDTTPSTSDNTDFGSIDEGGLTTTRSYLVRNDGNAVLTLSNLTVPDGFSVAEGLSASINPGASDTFTIRLNSTNAGVKTGVVSFNNNDSDENPYTFTITGIVAGPTEPEIAVYGFTNGTGDDVVVDDGVSIDDGDLSPRRRDGTDFGSVVANTAPPTHTFIVTNEGGGTLTLGSVSVPEGYTIIDDLVSSLQAGEQDELVVQLDTAVPGFKSGDISFGTNDSDENPFNFAVEGTVIAANSSYVTLFGNDTAIANGQSVTSLSDDTDFGDAAAGGDGLTRTFTIVNNSNFELALGSVTVTEGFFAIVPARQRLFAMDSLSFEIVLDDSYTGPRSGVVSVLLDNDPVNAYTFAVTGNVTEANGGGNTAPELTVLGNSVSITDGDSTPSTSDHTDFGGVEVGETASRTFTVRNDGDATLTLGAVTLPTGYSLTEPLVDSLAPGAFDTFTVSLDTSTVGVYAGDITFTSNDGDESPFNFAITGEVQVTLDEPVVATIGDGAAKSVTFTDADGTTATVQVKGGQAELTFGGTNVQVSETRKGIEVTGSDLSLAQLSIINASDANLSFKAKGGDGLVEIHEIAADGNVKSIKGKGVRLVGDVVILGTLGKADFTEIVGPGILSVGGGANDSGLSLKVGNVVDYSIFSDMPIKSLAAEAWLSTEPMTDFISAPAIDKVSIKGDLAASIDVTTMADLKAVSVGGWLDRAFIQSQGNIGGVKLGGMRHSHLLISTEPFENSAPTSATDFLQQTTGLKSLKISGKVDEGGDSFINSLIAAWSLGKVSLGEVGDDDAAEDFGVVGHDFKGVAFSLDGEKWKSPKQIDDGEIFREGRLVVRRV